jgi:hypothetical protein
MQNMSVGAAGFLEALGAFAGDEELTFERVGQGASVYEFHGCLKGVERGGMLRILRTRTNKGEMYTVFTHRILKVSRANGDSVKNPDAEELLRAWRAKDAARQEQLGKLLSEGSVVGLGQAEMWIKEARQINMDGAPGVACHVMHPLNQNVEFEAHGKTLDGVKRVLSAFDQYMKVDRTATTSSLYDLRTLAKA